MREWLEDSGESDLTIEIDRGVEAVLICPIYNRYIQRPIFQSEREEGRTWTNMSSMAAESLFRGQDE